MFLLLLFKKDKQIFPVSKPRIIERRIEGAEKVINNHTVQVIDQKKLSRQFDARIGTLMDSLIYFKDIRDTFNIVPIQDTLIGFLLAQGKVKDGIIAHQDTIISTQRYVINSKDTLLVLKDADLKRVKRQRNWSLVGNGILTGILILK